MRVSQFYFLFHEEELESVSFNPCTSPFPLSVSLSLCVCKEKERLLWTGRHSCLPAASPWGCSPSLSHAQALGLKLALQPQELSALGLLEMVKAERMRDSSQSRVAPLRKPRDTASTRA